MFRYEFFAFWCSVRTLCAISEFYFFSPFSLTSHSLFQGKRQHKVTQAEAVDKVGAVPSAEYGGKVLRSVLAITTNGHKRLERADVDLGSDGGELGEQ